MAIDYRRICRICLETNQDTLFDIYTSYDVKRNTLFYEMLSSCTKLKPHKEDGLPRLICKNCTRQLKRSYTFNIQCENSENKLKSYVRNQTTMINNIDNKINDADIKVKKEHIQIELVSKPNTILKPVDIEIDIKEETEIKNEDLIHIGLIADDSVVNNSESKIVFNETDDTGWDPDDDELLETFKINAADKVLSNEENVTNEVNEDVVKRKRRKRKKDGELSPHRSKLPHQCEECGKILSNKSNLKAHKLCHTDLRPYRCDDCPATFRGHSALYQHKKVHTRETPYQCDYCPKQFGRRTGLVNHIRMHTGQKLYSCEICCKTFVQSGQLSTHMKRHKGEKSFLCQDCGKRFPIRADLRVHQRVHSGEKPYACHLCTKTFATSGNLAIHVRIHNREIRYTCKDCERGFITASAYNVHVKRHRGQRDHRCECGKTFYTASALKQHKVVHTGEKRYQCKLCDRKFSQTSHLNRHFKKDHMKPNAPKPPVEQYRLVLTTAENGAFDDQTEPNQQKLSYSLDVLKCEES